ncbi:hypothetical protein ACFLTH_07275 [Bacteroidota bacterium]
MNKKLVSILVLVLFLLTIMPMGVLADGDDFRLFGESSVAENNGEGWIAVLASSIGGFFTSLANYVFPLPLPPHHEVSFLSMLLVFIVFFSVLFVASNKIPLFQNTEHPGAHKAFSIAVALLVTFFSPIAFYVQNFVAYYLTAVMIYGLVILGIVAAVWVTKWGGRGMSSTSEQLADKGARKRAKADYDKDMRELAEDKKYDKKIIQKDAKSIKELEKLNIQEYRGKKDLIRAWESVLEQLQNLRRKLSGASGVSNPEAQHLRDVLLQQIGNLVDVQNREEDINNKMELLTEQIGHGDANIVKNLEAEREDIRNGIIAAKNISDPDVNRRNQAADQELNKAKNFALEAEKIEKVIYNTEGEISKFDSELKDQENTLMSYLRANPPDADRAIDVIKEIIKILSEEENLLAKLLSIERKLAGSEAASFRLVVGVGRTLNTN